ncbi:hypothetical protein [Thomasclavelia cocleata]|uniref:hypothetical protein n=1 Tax=Thomasclavelia cocleata TaxID=69824 RepID=UPI002570AB7A|nr:hypothetical protein [Thomasclavelia cocleata]
MRIIEIHLNEGQVHACSRNIFYAGRQDENNVVAIKFTNHNLFLPGWKYYLKILKDDKIQEVPLLENLFKITTNLTNNSGIYACTLIARYNFGEKTKIFAPFYLEIDETMFNEEYTDVPMDPNILVLYEDLFKLKSEIEKLIDNIEINEKNIITQYESYQNFPTTGKNNHIYIDKKTNKFYYWDDMKYCANQEIVDVIFATNEDINEIIKEVF